MAPFTRRIPAPGLPALPRFGGYAPGTRESRVLQLLHEIGHLVVTDVYRAYVFVQLGSATRSYARDRVRLLLPVDGNNPTLSDQNTNRVLAACRDQIDALRNQN